MSVLKMNWYEISVWMHGEYTKLLDDCFDFHGRGIPPTELAAQLAYYNESTNEEIEDAIDEFLETGEWIPLASCAKVMLLMRLNYAADLSSALRSFPFHSTVCSSRAEAARWLLVDAWDQSGFSTIYDTLGSHL
jgi:hypothetical protein